MLSTLVRSRSFFRTAASSMKSIRLAKSSAIKMAPAAFCVQARRTYSSKIKSHQSRSYNTTGSGVRASQAMVVPETGNLRVVFEDGNISDFHPLWLRDNCQCPECVHPDTKQKLLDTVGIPLNLKVAEYSVDGNNVRVKYSGDNHSAVYSSEWLSKFIGSASNAKTHPEFNKSKFPKIVRWDEKFWEHNTMPDVQFSDTEHDDGMRECLQNLYKYGFAMVRNVPTEEGKIVEMAERISYVKETSYGTLFDVRSEPDPKAHLAFSGRKLDAHTDMNYRENSPGVQMLHCLKASGSGGMSFFVDGFNLAEWLRETHPSAFHILSTVEVPFGIETADTHYEQKHQILCPSEEYTNVMYETPEVRNAALKDTPSVCEVHINNRTMQPVPIPNDLVLPFYSSYQLIYNKMREDASELRFQMKPGDLVIFNNRRILHGRTGFDPSTGPRHLQGCYVDYDEFRAKLSMLL